MLLVTKVSTVEIKLTRSGREVGKEWAGGDARNGKEEPREVHDTHFLHTNPLKDVR